MDHVHVAKWVPAPFGTPGRPRSRDIPARSRKQTAENQPLGGKGEEKKSGKVYTRYKYLSSDRVSVRQVTGRMETKHGDATART